jgi:hypothetical protein
MAWFELKE